MKNIESTKEKATTDFDKIIKENIEMDLNQTDNTHIPTDDELLQMGYPLPPENMFEAIINACAEFDAENGINK